MNSLESSGTSPRTYALVAVLLALFFGQAVLSMRQKSVTVDETMYVTAGYYHLRTGDFALNMTNPPLMKVAAAFPLLFLGPDLPSYEGDPATWNEHEQWRFSRRFFYENTIDSERILFWARIPTVLIGCLLGLYVFRWSRELYGDKAGLLAMLLYAFSPNLLAHTRLATHDLGLTAFLFIAAYYFWRFLERPGLKPAILSGAFYGCAMLCKTMAIFVMPMIALLLVLLLFRHEGLPVWEGVPFLNRIKVERERTRRFLSAVAGCFAVGVAMVFVLNVGYLFQGSFQPISDDSDHPGLYEKLPVDNALTRGLVDLAVETPVPLPEPYVQLWRFQFGRVQAGYVMYFRGEWSRDGWWYLIPATWLIKTPLPVLLLFFAAVYSIARSRKLSRAETLLLTVVVCTFALFCYLKKISIGIRYVLPVFPLVLVLASRVLRDGVTRPRWAQAAVGVLATWCVLGTLLVHPHYLAHFNELIGGPKNGYRWVADSSLDWGQDLKGLKGWMDENDVDRIRLAYFGSGDASTYGIDYDYMPSVGLAPREPGDKWWFETETEELPPLELSGEPLAVSASLVAGVFYPGYYAPLLELEPVDQIGYSILIYEFE